MIDFKQQLRTIDGDVAIKIGDRDDVRFKHVVGVGNDQYYVDDDGDTSDMAGYFVNVPDGAQPEIMIDKMRLRLSCGVRVSHAKRGAGEIVAVRANHDNGCGFGILFEGGSTSDDDLFWSSNKSLVVEEGESRVTEDGTLEVTLPPQSVIRVLHDKVGPGIVEKIRSGKGKTQVLGVRPDTGRGLIWASFKSVYVRND